MKGLCALLGLALALPARGFEINDFRNGLSKDQVKALLPRWKFDKFEEVSADTLIAYDLPEKETGRQLKFFFCTDKLVVLEQAMKASLKNLITITSNYNNSYGQPTKVFAANNVVANGEKSSLIVSWRVKNEIVAVRYTNRPGGEDLSVAYEVPNNCFQVPRN